MGNERRSNKLRLQLVVNFFFSFSFLNLFCKLLSGEKLKKIINNNNNRNNTKKNKDKLIKKRIRGQG